MSVSEGLRLGVNIDHVATVRNARGGAYPDPVRAAVMAQAAGADGIPGAVADWKPRVDVWPRTTRGAEADVGFFRIPGSRDTYVDAVCSYANPQTYPGCQSTAGAVAERNARQKNADHPVYDPQTRRRLHPFDFFHSRVPQG